MKYLLCFFLLLATASVNADESLCLGGCPVGAPDTDRIADHGIFRLSQNPNTKFADWVAYVVTIKSKAGSESKRNFRGDPLIPNDEELEKSDYNGAHDAIGVDKGHQAPLAAFTGMPNWDETNYMSNITPQMADLNEGPWEKLEEAVRDLADYGYPVYVLTGPLYEREMPALPQANESHTVPSGYWKIVATFEEGEYWSAAFIMDQDTGRDASYCEKAVSIGEVEDRTGLDFFSGLGLNNEVAIESGTNDLVPWMGCEDLQ